MGHRIFTALILIILLQTCFAPPVSPTKKENDGQPPDSEYGGLENYMEYHRYLKEVVNALESDPEFRQKLEKADEKDIKSGIIAEELQFVSHHVRNRLDEIKRLELQRLRDLTEKKMKLEQSNSLDEDPIHHHLDQTNQHTFEIEDLKKLIKKTTEDLMEADKMRKDEFKQYEMEKEYQKQEKLNHTNGSEREKLEKEFQEMEQKHKKHQKLHEPGHKAQLEEVWEEQDQMQQDFDPKTFFMLHDIDSNGLWDQEEVKALFIKELDKMYQQGAPEDDMRERIEEMERMRESVYNEMDTNRDGFIDYREFLQQTNSQNFKQDNGWQALDEQTKPYTDDELAEYIRHHQPNNLHMDQRYPHGVPPGDYQQIPPGAYQQPGVHQQVPPNQQFHPGQVPQMVPQNLDLNTNEIHQEAPRHYPQQPAYQPNIPQQNPPQYQQQNPPQYQQQHMPSPNQPQYQQPNVVNGQQNVPVPPPQGQNFQQPPNPLQQQQYQQQNVPQQQHYQQPNVPQQQQHQQPNVPQQQQNAVLNQQNVGHQQPAGVQQIK